MESPVRQSRRNVGRRNIVIDEESEDELSLVHEEHDDDFEEAQVTTKRTARRTSPRKSTTRQTTNTKSTLDVSPRKLTTTATTATTRARRGAKASMEVTIVENSMILDPQQQEDQQMLVDEPVSPRKRASSPRKRTSAAVAGRSSRQSATNASRMTGSQITAPEPTPHLLPTSGTTSLQPLSQSHNINGQNQRQSTPLADITSKALNRRSSELSMGTKSGVSRPSTAEPALEKPVDIAIRAKIQSQAQVQAQTDPALDTLPATEPRSRMVIKQLVMTNFKSYAGRQVVGPFHVSFSSVVGPNGSGKSNVIDSLLFVFGFRASKMRQGKISALIHNSAQFQDLDFCEVEVHFQEIVDLPGGKHEIVPESQLVVSRKAFKNNSSNYYLNGRTTNFTTVTTLLKNKGIDLDHKRFLILQGEVESIAQMKPKAANEHDDGLLEYLEDIIGTSKYKAPIEEAAVELETLNEVCVEKQGRVQHVEKEKTGLEDKKNKALAYVRDENELAEKQSTLYQMYLAECEDNTTVTAEAIQQVQAQLDAELEKHTGSEDVIKSLEKQYKRAVKQFELMEKQTQEFLRDLAKYDKENVKFEERRKFIVGKQKKAEKLATTSRLAASEAKSLVERYSSDIESKSTEHVELEAAMQKEEAELAKIRESLKGKTQGLSDQITAKQKSLEPWNEKIHERESALAVSQSELDIFRERASAGQRAIDEGNARMLEIRETRQAKLNEIEERQYEKRRLEKDCRKIQDALQKLAVSEPEVRTQISSARQKAEEARASLVSTQNQGNVLKGLMRLKNSGRIEGFHGRLGNLGTIDEKFDVAISTACPSLENMVVDTVEAGQQCIEHLRKNNLGRANFVLLDRLAKRDLSPIQTPENVPRLFDLIKPKDSKFAPAFYSIMQNTLVATDLEQANRIAYGAKRWRVVTLDGQLIDVSGTMSGGGTRVARGAMSSKIVAETSQEQVHKLESERDQLEQQFEAFLDKQRELETSFREKQEEIPRLETVIQKLNLEVENCQRNLADTEKRVRDLTADLHNGVNYDSQIKATEKSIAAISEEIEQLKAETSSVQAEIEALQTKIMEVGGIQLRTQKGRVDSLKERIDLLADEISSAEVSKSKNEKLVTKHDKAHKEAEKELDLLVKDSEKLEADVQNQQSGAADSRARAEQAQEELDTSKEELSTLKKDLDGQLEELNSTRALEIEMRNKLEENQKILADNQKKSRYWAEKLSKVSLIDVDDVDASNKRSQVSDKSAQDPPADEMDLDGDHPMTDDVEQEQQSARLQLPTYTRDELLDKSKDHLVAAIAILEERVASASSIDLSVIAEYRRRCSEVASRTSDLNAALRTRDSAKNRLTDLRSLRLTQFMTGFTTISGHLKQMYQLITLGGNAELELVDSLDPFSEGILFSVMPPKKSWKNIGNLSGGEKTLSSLALVFALHVYRPTPLYVMDEIDAALDFRNVSIVAGYIKERTKNAQFIVISLRNNMFELAERLIGIYKVNHMTKSVTVENRDYLRLQSQEQQAQARSQAHAAERAPASSSALPPVSTSGS